MKNRRKSDRRLHPRSQEDRRAIYRLGILTRYGVNFITLGKQSCFESIREDKKEAVK